jgi:hypothetical protein
MSPNFARGRVEHVYPADLDHQLAVLLFLDGDVQLAEHQEQVAGPGLFTSSSPIARSGFIRTKSTLTLKTMITKTPVIE